MWKNKIFTNISPQPAALSIEWGKTRYLHMSP